MCGLSVSTGLEFGTFEPPSKQLANLLETKFICS